MTKQEIDKYFTDNYNTILKTTKSQLFKNKKLHIQTEVLINNLYLHIHKKMKEITDTSKLESYIYQYIKMESYWKNGTSSLQEKISDYEMLITPVVLDDSIEDAENLLESEYQIQNYRYILECFYQSLDFEGKRIYEMYFIKGLNNSRLISEHLNVSRTQGYIIVKKFRDQMEEYIKNNR